MGLTEATARCFRRYFQFSGRASRPEYWYFVLFCILGGIAASLLDRTLLGLPAANAPDAANGPIGSLFSLVTFVPLLSAGWRRMHDSGRSGLHLVYPLIVMVGVFSFAGFVAGFDTMLRGDLQTIADTLGALVLAAGFFVLMISPLLVLWWLTRPTQKGDNRYGPPPCK